MSYTGVTVNEADSLEQIVERVSRLPDNCGFYLQPGLNSAMDGAWKPSSQRLTELSLKVINEMSIRKAAKKLEVWEIRWRQFISGPTWEDWTTETELWLDMNKAYDRFEELRAKQDGDNGLYMRDISVTRREVKQ